MDDTSIHQADNNMVDNSWIEADKKTGGGARNITKVKVMVTVAIILIGAVGAICLNGLGSNATMYRSQGILMDLGDSLTLWTDADLNSNDDPVALLEEIKKEYASDGFDYTMADGILTSVVYQDKTYANGSSESWDLWYVPVGEFDAVRSDSYSIKVSDYTVVIWAFTTSDGSPSVAVDATATSIYGYSEPDTIVTLSPVCTEMLNAIGGIYKLVGTDSYSDYPDYVVKGHNDKSIAIVGSYTDPSYEAIMNTGAQMVFCDSSTYNDVQMAGMLRASNVNSVVLYSGDSVETIEKNAFITGIAMGYEGGSVSFMEKMEYAVNSIQDKVSGHDGLSVMIALSNDPSPWVSGSATYVDDFVNRVNGSNCYSEVVGWKNITAESIIKKNPECIIILDNGKYTSDEYDDMMRVLSNEWKSTDAYKNGKIYLLCEGLGEMSQRAGPRASQLMEIMSYIICPDAYPDMDLPKCIGDDFRDYLNYSKGVGD